MGTVQRPGEPVALVDALDELLDRSDERALELRLRLAAWREGYAASAAAVAEAWSAGYAHAIAEVKAAQHGIVLLTRGLAEVEGRRWMVRGERRRRETFGQPHPDDYPGQKAGAA